MTLLDRQIDDSTLRALQRLPELLSIVRDFAFQGVTADAQCHKGLCSPAQCCRCGPILEAKALIEFIDGEPSLRIDPQVREATRARLFQLCGIHEEDKASHG